MPFAVTADRALPGIGADLCGHDPLRVRRQLVAEPGLPQCGVLSAPRTQRPRPSARRAGWPATGTATRRSELL
jgi:hypothetical protein